MKHKFKQLAAVLQRLILTRFILGGFFVIRKPRDSRGVQRRLKPMRITKELRLCKISVDLPVNEKIHNRRTLECESKITSRIV